MAGELIVKHGLRVSGSTIASGSITATSFTGSFSGSITSASYAATASIASTASFFSGSISNATSASFASTASLAPLYTLVSATSSMLAPYLLITNTSSFVVNSQTGSFVQNSQTSSFVVNSQTGSFVLNSFTSSMLTPYMLVSNTGSMLSPYTPNSQTGSLVQNSFTASMLAPYMLVANTGSMLSPYTPNSQTGSFVRNNQTSSFVQNSQTSSFVSSSQLNSYLLISESGSFVKNSFTSSMLAPYLLVANTSSFATTTQLNSYLLLSNTSSMLAPYLPTGLTGSFAKQNASNSFVGTQVITGSLFITGSGASGSFSGSFIGDGSGLSGVAASFPITPGVVNASTQYFVSNTSVSQYITHTQVANILAGNGLISNGTALLVNSSSFSGSFLLISSTGSMLAPYLLVANTGSMLSPYTPNSQTGSFIRNNQTSSFYTGSFTGSFIGTSSFASTASYVNTLNQNILITGSLTVGSSSLGASENTITLGARDAGSEGGQLGLNAPGGTYTSASFIDNYNNLFRILRGSNVGSDGLVAQWNLHTKQMQLPAYTGASSFVGTATANLAVDSSGNIITVSTSGGTVFPYVGAAVISGSLIVTGSGANTGSITANGPIYSLANNAMYFRGGDDAEFWDINIANTVGIYGQQNQTVAGIKLGSAGATLYGSGSRFGIGTITPVATLDVNGNLFVASGITGSITGSLTGALTGTASYASTSDTLDGLHSNAFVTNNVTSSMLAPYLLVANTSSFATTSQLASYLLISNTASMIAPYLLISNTSSMLSSYLPTTRTGSLATTGSGTFSGSITISSSLGVGTAAPTTVGLIRATNDVVAFYSSDERLKTNKQIISNPLEKLNQINGYEFDWIPTPGIHENEGHDIGVIAQEIEKVLPEIVTTRDNGYKAVKYEKIVALLIEAVKDLQNQVNELKNGNSNF